MIAPFVLVLASMLAAGEFKPRWGDAVIEVAGHQIKPLRIVPDWTFEYKVGKRRFTVVGDAVNEVDPTTGQKQWTATADDHAQLVWLDANEATAFFVAESDNSDEAANQVGGESIIRRLDLETHRWSSPLLLPKAEPEPEQSRLPLSPRSLQAAELLATLPTIRRCDESMCRGPHGLPASISS